MIYWTTYNNQREGSINAIDQGSGNLSVIVASSQQGVITQPWYTYGKQDFRLPQKISVFHVWLSKAELKWTGHGIGKEQLRKREIKLKENSGTIQDGILRT